MTKFLEALTGFMELILKIFKYFDKKKEEKKIEKNENILTKEKLLGNIQVKINENLLYGQIKKEGIKINKFRINNNRNYYRIIYKYSDIQLGVQFNYNKTDSNQEIKEFYYYIYTQNIDIQNHIKSNFQTLINVHENKYCLEGGNTDLEKTIEKFIELKNTL